MANWIRDIIGRHVWNVDGVEYIVRDALDRRIGWDVRRNGRIVAYAPDALAGMAWAERHHGGDVPANDDAPKAPKARKVVGKAKREFGRDELVGWIVLVFIWLAGMPFAFDVIARQIDILALFVLPFWPIIMLGKLAFYLVGLAF